MNTVSHCTANIAGLNIFYREAGKRNKPTILLLHGFPSSSHMFRDLMPVLADSFHLIAPDYPGFGYSSMPPVNEFEYSFDNVANVIEQLLVSLDVEQYSVYLMDYGASVGFRLFAKRPEAVQSLIIQNGNAYDDGLTEFWGIMRAYWNDRNAETEKPIRDQLTPENTRYQYQQGARDPQSMCPDAWTLDQAFLDRPGNTQIQLELLYDFQKDLQCYPRWQECLRRHQPPALIVWGTGDPYFSTEWAQAYLRDLEKVELYLCDGGHFLLEEQCGYIAERIREFLNASVSVPASS